MTELFLYADDFDVDATWRLLDWCLSAGADEFTLATMLTPGRPAPLVERLEALLEPFALGEAPRQRVTRAPDEDWIAPVPRWRLTPRSVAVLRECFPNGLFTPPSYADAGWAEDPILYREGELLLGVISHEGYGLMQCTTLESAQLSAAGIVLHTDARPWI